ncbi:MAG: hypothetical protein IKN48_11245, partial [Bacteroidaceae bacterium]|nr:hypothetical protein [Bacteroidaceae bacterium]
MKREFFLYSLVQVSGSMSSDNFSGSAGGITFIFCPILKFSQHVYKFIYKLITCEITTYSVENQIFTRKNTKIAIFLSKCADFSISVSQFQFEISAYP